MVPAIHRLKAKSAAYGGESLAEHTLNVVRRMGELQRRLPELQGELGISNFWSVMFWAAWLHDFGKAADGFQAMLSGGPRWPYRHEVLSLAFLPWVFEPGSREYALAAAAIASHHRDFKVLSPQYISVIDPSDSGIDARWASEMDLWRIEALAEWTATAAGHFARHGLFADNVFALRSPNSAVTHKEGPDHIREALHAYENYYTEQAKLPRFGARTEAKATVIAKRHEALCLRGLMLQADRLASANAPELETPMLAGVEQFMAESEPWYAHQREAANAGGSALLSAPTSSGKTEAALLWARHQQDEPRPGAVFYLLPYQASINAMHRRIVKNYRVPENTVALMHSRAVQAIYRDLMSSANDTASEEAANVARRRKSLGRLHQQPICVTTPYQLLRAAFRLPGYEGQWAMLHGAHLIVDEVHGYEPIRMGLLLGLFETLRRDWNVRIFAMTATMPTWLREDLVNAIGASQSIHATQEVFARFRRHRLHIVPGQLTDPKILERVCRCVQDGEAVLVVANLVDTAQSLADTLGDQLGQERVVLLHSRFTGEDRLTHEAELMQRVGAPVRVGFVAVATQVVEVSLDVDFDTIYTEPAPLEALLQRFGRVNRRRLHAERPVHVMEDAVDWQRPYGQEELLRRTIDLLARHHGSMLDEALTQDWLDEVYAAEVDRLTQQVFQGRAAFEKIAGPEQLIAFESDPGVEEQFNELFDGYEILPEPLYEEFIARIEAGLGIEAYALTVPISSRRFHALRHKGRVRWLSDHRLYFAECAYDRKTGLSFAAGERDRPAAII